ncbi:MAG TPA: LysE family transporter [Chitinophagales bacterium]|jgi:amino acid exporter|nr:LysE family transporter [Chitinophagales bacterium]
MEPLLKGIISGITISFLIGPIFLALADITITKGWRSGLSYIAGVLISDIVLIYLVETILQQFPFDSIKTQIGIVGGIMLIAFGIVTYFAKATLKAQDVTSVKTLFQAFLKGVSLNMFNPFVTVWWITMYTTVTINYDTFTDRFLFYFGILFMVFLFDLLKMRFAYYLKQRLTENNLSVIKKVVGACLFIFGVVMIVKVA